MSFIHASSSLDKYRIIYHDGQKFKKIINLIKAKTILFNLCGHGHFDMQAYGDYFNNKLSEDKYNEGEVNKALEKLPKIA